MFKYYLLNIRYFLACVLAIAIICAAVVVGGAVGLVNDRKDALKDFESGFLDYGVRELLVYRADYARQLSELHAHYLSPDKADSDALHAFIAGAKNSMAEPEALSSSVKAADIVLTSMISRLLREDLSYAHKSELDSIVMRLNENRDSIVQSDYNKKAAEFNDEIKRFPGDIYAGYLDLKPLAVFE